MHGTRRTSATFDDTRARENDIGYASDSQESACLSKILHLAATAESPETLFNRVESGERHAGMAEEVAPMSSSPDPCSPRTATNAVRQFPDGSNQEIRSSFRHSYHKPRASFPGAWASSTLASSLPTSFSGTSSSSVSVSAASMIRVASQAGLHSVSSCLATQAQTQIHHGAASSLGTTSGSLTSESTLRSPPIEGDQSSFDSSVHPRRASTSAEYSAAMNAHISSALRGVHQLSRSSPHISPTPAASGFTSISQPAELVRAQAQMAEIATRTAKEEAERQLRLQAMLRVTLPASSLPTEDGESKMLSSSENLTEHRRGDSNNSHFGALGLSHIPMPSDGFEQSWGRLDESIGDGASRQATASLPAPKRYYDAKDALAGVPSLPCKFFIPTSSL